MNFTMLFSKILMMPFDKARELFEEYNKNIGFEVFAEQQRIIDILYRRKDIVERLKEDVIQDVAFAYTFMSLGKDSLANSAFLNMKKYPMVVWVEAVRFLKVEDIKNLLNNFYDELTPAQVGMFIVNLSESLQLEAIDKYYKKFETDDESFNILYYAVCEKAREKLNKYFKSTDEDILLKAKDVLEDEALSMLLENKDSILEINPDDFIEFVLLKFVKASSFDIIIKNFREIIDKISLEKFELFFTRYKYLVSYRMRDDDDCYYDGNNEKKHFGDLELFDLFKSKFSKLGIPRTLSLFDNNENGFYYINELYAEIVLRLLDIAYLDSETSEYVNNETIVEIYKRFIDKCNKNSYTLEEFEKLVKKAGSSFKTKLIHDDYLEAIIACGKLLNSRVIDDQNPLFIELREKFSNDLITRAKKDGTYTNSISLNGLFYRLAKGSIPFQNVYMTETFKGLVYLTKCGKSKLSFNHADYVTKFLTDEQLVKLNISPLLKWRKTFKKIENDDERYGRSLAFTERMGLQLLLFFGKDKAKYLLDSDMQDNFMENIFDGLNYSKISIDDYGIPNTNKELIDFLFGRGRMSENNSTINRMIRGEIKEFKSYFTEFCNGYFDVKEFCRGLLSVKRVVRYFSNVDLPVELKPDEILFKDALSEMKTINEERLLEGIKLCKAARDREYSTIPKVVGKLGDFKYEVLDLDDPLAVAVGELSHCCFVVGGISSSALKHSMQSKNGRTFVVYYKGKFLAQSWIWRNGDVICFDSVEAGFAVHNAFQDDIKLVNVYKEAAEKMLKISQNNEDDVQQVKLVTVGKSDYTFKNLERIENILPRPLEKNVYVYDSNVQNILAGDVLENIRYGEVGARYYDFRKKALIFNDFSNFDVDELDRAILNINALRYRVHGIEEMVDFTNYLKIYSGDGWYILIDLDGNIESGKVKSDLKTEEEFEQYWKEVSDCDVYKNSLVKTF